MERRGSRGKETWGKEGIERIVTEIVARIIPQDLLRIMVPA